MRISPEALAEDASLYLHSIDFGNRVAVFYRAEAAQLNDLCQHAAQGQAMPIALDALLGQQHILEAPLPVPTHFVWMTDFCGSTLYAKSLNATAGLFVYNEPHVYADLANARRMKLVGQLDISDEQWSALLKLALFYSRKTFAAGDTAVVKEWPASNFIIRDVLAGNPDSRAIFLYGSLEDYLTACLKYPARRETARARVQGQFIEMRSLPALQNVDPRSLSDAQCAALHWLYLMYWHEANGFATTNQMRTLDSRQFFADPSGCLQRSAAHLGTTLETKAANEIVQGPIFTRHSKEGRAFSLADHEASLAAARQRFGREIEQGLAWARELAEAHPLEHCPGTALN